ncbi:hypothetical protein D3C76_1624700 [compost metagenome]
MPSRARFHSRQKLNLLLPAVRSGRSYSTMAVRKPTQDNTPFMNNCCSGNWRMAATTLRSSRRKSPTFSSIRVEAMRLCRR